MSNSSTISVACLPKAIILTTPLLPTAKFANELRPELDFTTLSLISDYMLGILVPLGSFWGSSKYMVKATSRSSSMACSSRQAVEC